MKYICTILSLLITYYTTQAQVKGSAIFETGYMQYALRTINVDPGPNWKGYNLDSKQSAFHLTGVYGLDSRNTHFFYGIGASYLNFQWIHGLGIFAQISYMPSQKLYIPFIQARIGYSHIWNQYEHGKGYINNELAIGIPIFKIQSYPVYIKTGITNTQQAIFIPLTIGIKF